ncbi:MAG: hypothetical protein H6737_17750 [Alphaproteobacteria bacterium]|nr:hypothetical protein [Alphaproteobacteria bacterium]
MSFWKKMLQAVGMVPMDESAHAPVPRDPSCPPPEGEVDSETDFDTEPDTALPIPKLAPEPDPTA